MDQTISHQQERQRGIRRVGQVAAGVVIVIVGIVLSGPGIPGPGLLVIVLGLNMVAPNNRLSRWIRRKAPGVPEEGPIPRNQIIGGLIFTVAMFVVAFLYGPSLTDWFLDLVGIDLKLPWQD